MKKYLVIIGIILIVGVGVIAAKITYKSNPGMMNHTGMTQEKPIQSHSTYSLKITSKNPSPQANQIIPILYTIVNEQGNILKNFALDHTKLMHFIVVRNDLQDFQHVHPDFNKNSGEFSIPVTFPRSGTYRLFADFTPANGQNGPDGNPLAVTVFQDMQVGNTNTPAAVTPDSKTTKTVDGYELTYTLTQSIQSGNENTIKIHVTKNGQSVTTMEEYLGAQAHGILLKRDTLDFAHLHTMGNDTATTGGHMMMEHTMQSDTTMTNTGPDITFTYTFPESGIYKLFTQFQVAGKVVTSDYTFEVK